MMSSSDSKILEMFSAAWDRGDYKNFEGVNTWEPGKPAVLLARCAWLKYVKDNIDESNLFPFDAWLQVEVHGVDPVFF